VHYIPISALLGDNVVDRSTNMAWYAGPTLLSLLETTHISSDHNHVDGRFPVQYVIRPQSNDFHDYRGYAGRVAGGVFRPGDRVRVLPSGFATRVKAIDTLDGPIEEAFAPLSVTMTLEDEIDISRGDMIIKAEDKPEVSQEVDINICWLNERPLHVNGKYALKHTTKDARCVVKAIKFKLNISTLAENEIDKTIRMNDIARISIRTTQPLFFDQRPPSTPSRSTSRMARGYRG
jgi:sulfate adenylyltransferase subunit 1